MFLKLFSGLLTKTDSINLPTYLPPYDKKKEDKKYLCPKCNELFRNVSQASCGCRYCRTCLDELFETSKICIVETCKETLDPTEIIPDRAFQKEILNMKINCISCSWIGKLSEYYSHYDTTHCQIQPIKCTFHAAGCNYNGILNRLNLNQHRKDYIVQHIELLNKYSGQKLNYLEQQVNDISNANNTESEANLPKIKIKPIDQPGTSSKKSRIDSADTTSTATSSKLISIERIQINLFEDINKNAVMYESILKDVEDMKQNHRKLKNDSEQIQKTLTFAQATIINLEERLQAIEKTSFNGTLVWKITNVKDKIMEAKSGRQTSFYSAPFYSHHNGYKMCARVYLNGDGMGRGTHLSLFFVLLKGEYDALLRWPFRQKVTFILIDQSSSESKENIIDAFRPDPNSTSFKRPILAMNVASGIPLFCLLPKLSSTDHEYIKQDTMFIKVVVDTRGLVEI